MQETLDGDLPTEVPIHRQAFLKRSNLIKNVQRHHSPQGVESRVARVGLVIAFLVLSVVPGFAQNPVDNAWTILKTGLADKGIDQRARSARVLGLMVNNPEAEKLALAGLEDGAPEVRRAAAGALGQMNAKSALPKLVAILKEEKDPSVVLAGARSLLALGDTWGYAVYYAVLTGEKKSGGSLLEEQRRMLNDPKKMAMFGFEQGIGFVPFGSLGYGALKTLAKDESSTVRAAAAKILADDPDLQSRTALVEAASDKSWIVRTAALEALSRREDPSVLGEIELKLTDEKPAVRLTAAAAVIHLNDIRSSRAQR